MVVEAAGAAVTVVEVTGAAVTVVEVTGAAVNNRRPPFRRRRSRLVMVRLVMVHRRPPFRRRRSRLVMVRLVMVHRRPPFRRRRSRLVMEPAAAQAATAAAQQAAARWAGGCNQSQTTDRRGHRSHTRHTRPVVNGAGQKAAAQLLEVREHATQREQH